MSSSHSISIPRTARYYTLSGGGEAPSAAADVWFVLHGYGQLAEDFLQAFVPAADGSRLFVAPEGLSRFYLENGAGPIGASWMTKLGREEEIDDYVRFLDAVYGEVLGRWSSDSSVHVLGFSQGAATAARWATLGVSRLDRLTLWAGGVPPDLDLVQHRERLERMNVSLIVGSRDPFLDGPRLAQETERLSSAGVMHRVVHFDGGHRLDDETLARLAGT